MVEVDGIGALVSTSMINSLGIQVPSQKVIGGTVM